LTIDPRYAFPPLLKSVIAEDIGLSHGQILTSNIIALLATLLVRLVAGTACDRFGARWTFAGTLLIGAIPTFLAGTAYTFSELCALRFFIGILGGSFVPCQVWTTAFFDKNVVGTANALTAGFGNAGGGVTYFVMPAVFASLVKNGLSTSTAWRVSFVVPGILIVSVAVLLILLCPDTPTGKWSERNNVVPPRASSVASEKPIEHNAKDEENLDSGSKTPPDTKKTNDNSGSSDEGEVAVGEQYEVDAAQMEVIQKPTWKEAMTVVFSPQTLVLGAVSL
jgi:MFS transporter, NNP family, nitrate/nitrite transporter